MKSVLIDIGIATYKRPQQLLDLLVSLGNLVVKESIQFRLIIIDNDHAQSAHPIVKQFLRQSQIETYYEVEPVQNIALVRNRCLARRKGEYFAFIDDDETAVSCWLQSLFDCMHKYDARIVFGPVFPIFQEGTPKLYTQSGFGRRGPFPTGTIRANGGTGNVLIHPDILKREDFTFNPAYGITGGSDFELFYRMNKNGIKMVWCNEAMAFEKVSHSRANVIWAIKRSFRGGQNWARICVPDMRWVRKITWFLKRIIIFIVTLLGQLLWLIRPAWGFKAIQKCAVSLGQLTAKFQTLQYLEYKNVTMHDSDV